MALHERQSAHCSSTHGPGLKWESVRLYRMSAAGIALECRPLALTVVP